MAINWKRRSVGIMGSFVTGYSGGLALTVPGFSQALQYDYLGMFAWPALAGLVVSLPQLGKILSEYGGNKNV